MDSPLIKNVNLFLDDKPSVFALRNKARIVLDSIGFPTLKTEAWKYTDIKELINKDFNINTKENACSHECCHHHNEDTSFIEIRFCNGKLHVEEYNTPEGITLTPLPVALFDDDYKKYFFNAFNLEKHPFAALNGLYFEQGICIHIEKNTSSNKPILIKYNQKDCDNLQLSIHNLIILEKGAKLELIEDFTSASENTYFTNTVNEVYLKTESELTHYKIQKENSKSYHIALNAIKQQEKSSYKQYYLSDGAKLSRQETLVNLDQQNANAEIYSAYMAKKNCTTDITTNINHLVENTNSNQYAKGVLEEDSTAVFQGKIHIASNAVKTSGHQLHKALYLSDSAKLNCKPELEIYADDVKCSHGASCGELDKEQLFYLLSRGIEKHTAIKLLTDAHLEELLSLIPNPKIKELFFGFE